MAKHFHRIRRPARLVAGLAALVLAPALGLPAFAGEPAITPANGGVEPAALAASLMARGKSREAVILLEPYCAAHPEDKLAQQTLIAARVSALEAEIRDLLTQQADSRQLLVGGPDYEEAKARSERSVAGRLDVVEVLIAQRRYSEAVDGCNAILRDHPHEPAAMRMKYRLLNVLVEREREALFKEKAIRRERGLNEATESAIWPYDKPRVARKVWIFDEDIQEAERLKMRTKLQERIPALKGNKVAIRELLDPLFALAGINYVILDSAISDETLSVSLVNETIEQALDTIAKMVKITYNYRGNSVFITSADSDILVTEKIVLQSGLVDVTAAAAMGVSDTGGGGGGGGGAGAGTNPNTPYNPAIPGGGAPPRPAGGGGAGGGNGGGANSDLERFLKEVPNIIVNWPSEGKFHLDRKSNTLFVKTTPWALSELKRLLAALDYNPLQVKIETCFIEITDQGLKDLGVNLATGGTAKIGTDTLSFSGPAPYGTVPTTPFSIGGGAVASSSTGILGQLIYDSKHYGQFQMQIAALETKGQANTLTKPAIVTLSNARGLIDLTRDIVYISGYNNQAINQPVTSSGTGSVTFQSNNALVPTFATAKAGITLDITPSVARNGDVISLTVSPTVTEMVRAPQRQQGTSSGDSSTVITPIDSPPEFATRKLFTRLNVKSGQTVVLGGLTSEHEESNTSGTPGLSRLPVLGVLFRRKTDTTTRTNLIITVRATLLDTTGAEVSDEIETLRDTVKIVLPPDARDAQAVKDAAAAKEAEKAAAAAKAPESTPTRTRPTGR